MQCEPKSVSASVMSPTARSLIGWALIFAYKTAAVTGQGRALRPLLDGTGHLFLILFCWDVNILLVRHLQEEVSSFQLDSMVLQGNAICSWTTSRVLMWQQGEKQSTKAIQAILPPRVCLWAGLREERLGHSAFCGVPEPKLCNLEQNHCISQCLRCKKRL